MGPGPESEFGSAGVSVSVSEYCLWEEEESRFGLLAPGFCFGEGGGEANDHHPWEPAWPSEEEPLSGYHPLSSYSTHTTGSGDGALCIDPRLLTDSLPIDPYVASNHQPLEGRPSSETPPSSFESYSSTTSTSSSSSSPDGGFSCDTCGKSWGSRKQLR